MACFRVRVKYLSETKQVQQITYLNLHELLLRRFMCMTRARCILPLLLENVQLESQLRLLASHLDVLYILEFSFRSNRSQWRSMCVFGAYIEVSLREFFGGPYHQGMESFKHFLNSY